MPISGWDLAPAVVSLWQLIPIVLNGR